MIGRLHQQTQCHDISEQNTDTIDACGAGADCWNQPFGTSIWGNARPLLRLPLSLAHPLCPERAVAAVLHPSRHHGWQLNTDNLSLANEADGETICKRRRRKMKYSPRLPSLITRVLIRQCLNGIWTWNLGTSHIDIIRKILISFLHLSFNHNWWITIPVAKGNN